MKRILFILLVSLTLVSCSKDETSTTQKQPTASVAVEPVKQSSRSELASQSDFEFSKVVSGGKLFKQNCAECHGVNAQGTPGWRKRKPDGKLKPPPLNGTGHMWHHSRAVLTNLIINGTLSQGGGMPAWGGKLTQQEIDAIITWIQSKWPEEAYKSWLEINNR